jgi:low temperature requirement protein LtrA
VLGLIAIAVADELAIVHRGDDATLGFTIPTFGGPALFLLAQLLFQHAALGRAPRPRALGLGAQLTLIVGIVASSTVLIVVAITDTVQARVQAPSRST